MIISKAIYLSIMNTFQKFTFNKTTPVKYHAISPIGANLILLKMRLIYKLKYKIALKLKEFGAISFSYYLALFW